MIKAIFFDYDGVLTTDRSGSLTTDRFLSAASGIAQSTISAAFQPFIGDLIMGRVTHAQIWNEACQAIGKELDIGLLLGAFESTPVNAGMFNLARRLKHNHAVGIITDNRQDRMDHLRQHQQLDALFAPIVVSSEVGSAKDTQAIFVHALSRAAVAPRESIFIDNSEANLRAARALGMHGVFHDDAKNDVEALGRQLEALGARIGDSATSNAQ